MKNLTYWTSVFQSIFTSDKNIQANLDDADCKAVGPVAYSLEVLPDRTIIGIKTQNCHPENWIVDAPMSKTEAHGLWEYMTDGDELVGFGNLSHDTYIMEAILDGASPQALHKLSQNLKKGKDQNQALNRLGIKPLFYQELDLERYAHGLTLKYIEHMKSFTSSIALSETKVQRNEVDMACIVNLECFLNALMSEYHLILDTVKAKRKSELMGFFTGGVEHV